MDDFIAHSSSDRRPGQPLEEHLANVQRLAVEFAAFIKLGGFEEAARLSGRWHDLGKACSKFQRKLKEQPRMLVNHKSAGAYWALRRGWNDVAFVIEGHHSGLPDLSDLKSLLTSEGKTKWEQVVKLWQERRPDLLSSGQPDYTCFRGRPHAFDLHVRMLFSCLIDADFLDTEGFLCPEKSNLRKPEWPELPELRRRFFANQEDFMRKAGAVGEKDEKLYRLRCEMYREAVGKAEQARGVFSMAIPTGGGKTRTALGFAFKHARHNGQRRIIVALPYTSILDQMAKEYSDIFGADGFLEHHSGWQPPQGKDEETPEVRRMLMACENWDASLILTTTVQLFDSLFSNRVSDCRKLHNIAGSVVVLDEVQTLPVKYLEPICDVLAELVRSYNVTVLLSTATQPALDRVKSFVKPEPLIAEPLSAFTILKRVNYRVDLDTPWDWEKVADELMKSERGGMAIVNLKRHAVELFKALQSKTDDPESCFHLSTFMCSAHRKNVIHKVRNRLEAKLPCRLVSTQVVEAGVDLDFPLVLRAVGPLDRVVQAAGRCNREGRMKERGKVIVFEPASVGMPRGEYETGAGLLVSLYKGGRFDLDNPETYEKYFTQLFDRRALDAAGIQDKRKRLCFEEVAKAFHLIEDGGLTAVLAGYGGPHHKWEGSPASDLVKSLMDKKGDSRRSIFRRLQAYTIQVYADKFRQMHNRLILETGAPDLYYWFGGYDEKLGIGAGQLDIDSSIL